MKLPVLCLAPGMKVARPVYGARGELLLQRGTELTASIITNIRKRRILALYVETNLLSDDDIEAAQNILDEAVRIETLALVQEWIKNRVFGF